MWFKNNNYINNDWENKKEEKFWFAPSVYLNLNYFGIFYFLDASSSSGTTTKK